MSNTASRAILAKNYFVRRNIHLKSSLPTDAFLFLSLSCFSSYESQVSVECVSKGKKELEMLEGYDFLIWCNKALLLKSFLCLKMEKYLSS